MNVPFSDHCSVRSSAISLSPILISETTDDDRLHDPTGKFRIEDLGLAMFEPPPLDSYTKKGVHEKTIGPMRDLSSASDISESETTHFERERIANPILVSKTTDDDQLHDSTSKIQIDNLGLVMVEPPPLDSYERLTRENGDCCPPRARMVSLEAVDTSDGDASGCDWNGVFEPSAPPVVSENVYPFLHLEANHRNTFWTIQILDNGRVPAGQKGIEGLDSLWFRVYFQPEQDYVYYQGHEIIDCVRDLLEFHGRSVFNLQKMSTGTQEVARANEVIHKLQQLMQTVKS